MFILITFKKKCKQITNMLSVVNGCALIGIDAWPVSVEVDVSVGLPGETIVGLPDLVIKESKSRIKSAIRYQGYQYPVRAITVNLAPAELRKEGPLLDLPIAVGILQSSGQLPSLSNALMVGELSMTGDIRPVRGMVSICALAKDRGYSPVIVPVDNLGEAQLVPGLSIIPVKSLRDLADLPAPLPAESRIFGGSAVYPDLSDVRGQVLAKRALTIAAAGNHNILFIGSPGTGKTMLVKRLPGILPDMTIDELIATYRIASIAQKSPIRHDELTRPFRSPHHSISYAGMAGGGKNPTPGEMSLAHNGVLFLDELPEFSRYVIELLRQPLESHSITISRANFNVEFPARFLLAAAMNPCPCGYRMDPIKPCTCSPGAVQHYRHKISGPLLDRIDLIVAVNRLGPDDYQDPPFPIESETIPIKALVTRVRSHQATRFGDGRTAADMTSREIRELALPEPIRAFLRSAIDKGVLSGRSHDKVVKVAQTIADMAESEILMPHIQEAIRFRKIAWD